MEGEAEPEGCAADDGASAAAAEAVCEGGAAEADAPPAAPFGSSLRAPAIGAGACEITCPAV